MSWAHYILQVNIYLIVFYGFYKLLLDKETYFLLNRIYLVSAAALSLSIPFIRSEWLINQTAARPVYLGTSQLNDLMTQVIVANETPERFSSGNLIVLIYLTGTVIFALLFIYRLFAVYQLFQKATSGNAFSFLHKKRVDQDLPGIKTIHRHEDIHIRQYHTLDILFFELLNIFIWFNPVIYFYKRTIKNIHEYLADEKAAEFQGDKAAYALLLLSSAFGIDPNGLTNTFFNKSLIKKRIFMLHKQRSTRTAMLKYGLFLPLFAVTLVMSSATIRNNDKMIAITDEIPLNAPLNIIMAAAAPAPDPDWAKFYTFLKTTIKYPAAARNAGIQGNSQVKFSLQNGKVESISVVNRLSNGFESEVMKTLLDYKGFKNTQNGNYTLQITFKLQGSSSPMRNPQVTAVKDYKALNPVTVVAYSEKNTAKKKPATPLLPANESDKKVYDFVSIDQQPTFEGGMDNFYKYLKTSVKYPVQAQKNNVQGKVFLSFVVEKDGVISDVKVERALGAGTDEEAVRVLRESPKWIPGVLEGRPVRVKYNIPISFSLDRPVPTGENGKTGSTNEVNFSGNNVTNLTFKGTSAKNEPLYLIDGKKSATGASGLDPNQIESINVLKGESAITQYGVDGANGVIIVTTKEEARRLKSETKNPQSKKD